METKMSDWSKVLEAEKKGLMASMTGIVERHRTPRNEELSGYFRAKKPWFTGIFDEDIAEDALDAINEFLEKTQPDMKLLDFPLQSGTNVYLIPVTENLEAKVLAVDEYYGAGDYSNFVSVEFFVINEHTTTEDVDALIEFVDEYLLGEKDE